MNLATRLACMSVALLALLCAAAAFGCTGERAITLFGEASGEDFIEGGLAQ
jgi:hypothetical protein